MLSNVDLSYAWRVSNFDFILSLLLLTHLVLPYLDEEGSGEAHDVDQHDGGQAQIMNTLKLVWIEMFLLRASTVELDTL